MKELATLILVTMASLVAMSQATVKNFTDKYRNEKDATVVTLKGNVFNLLGDVAQWSDDEEAETAARVFKGIKSMEVLSLSLYDAGISKQEITDLKNNLAKEKYEEYITAREGSQTVVVYAQGTQDNVSNMLILVQERDEFTLVNIDGTLNHKDLAYIVKHHDDWD
jgi:phosphatidate phosphatase PAH1